MMEDVAGSSVFRAKVYVIADAADMTGFAIVRVFTMNAAPTTALDVWIAVAAMLLLPANVTSIFHDAAFAAVADAGVDSPVAISTWQ
jgi:hypothetical protein